MQVAVHQVTSVPIGKVREAPWNANKQNKTTLEKLRRSIRTFGVVENNVLRPDWTVGARSVEELGRRRTSRMDDVPGWYETLSGNHRLKLFREEGMAAVSAVVVELPDPQAKVLAQALNRTRGEDERGALDALLRDVMSDLPASDVASLLPQTERELDALLKGTAAVGVGEEAEDIPPPAAAPVSERGTLYQLGPHRVLCGDATKAEDVALLMDGEQAGVVVTDPPYAIYGSSTGIASDIADDRMVVPFFEAILRSCSSVLGLFGHAYTCADWRSWSAWWEASRRTDMKPKNAIAWDKGSAGLGSMYANCYELVGFWVKCPKELAITSAGKRGEGRNERHKLVMQPNVIRQDRVPHKERHGHNAAKPVELMSIFIENSSDAGEVVVDFFLGSGTTLIAAAKLGRRCFGTEIDPAWVDVIRRRWTKYARASGVDPGPNALEPVL
jgi:DNA modification methylase